MLSRRFQKEEPEEGSDVSLSQILYAVSMILSSASSRRSLIGLRTIFTAGITEILKEDRKKVNSSHDPGRTKNSLFAGTFCLERQHFAVRGLFRPARALYVEQVVHLDL